MTTKAAMGHIHICRSRHRGEQHDGNEKSIDFYRTEDGMVEVEFGFDLVGTGIELTPKEENALRDFFA